MPLPARSAYTGRYSNPVVLNLCPAIPYRRRFDTHLGPTLNADIHHVELARVNAQGELESPKVYDLEAIQSHSAPDIPLRPNDRVIIRALNSSSQCFSRRRSRRSEYAG